MARGKRYLTVKERPPKMGETRIRTEDTVYEVTQIKNSTNLHIGQVLTRSMLDHEIAAGFEVTIK